MFTRRHAMGLVAASVLLGRSASAQPRVLFRKSASALDPDSPEMAALRTAIPQLRASGLWDRLVAVHAMNWRQHHSWLFLPWHRAFLYEFELAVRRLTYDDFRMPYLDWDADRIPAMLYDPPFAHDGRVHGPDDSMRAFQGTGGWFWQSAPRPFDDFFGAPDYGGDDESYGHNLIHIFVGGDMGNILTAPRDPLFWFHHANVDRLWWYWSNQYGCNTADCYSQDWQSEQVRGVIDPDGSSLPPLAVRSLLTTAALGYEYRSAPMVMMAAPRQELAAAPRTPGPSYTRTLHLVAAPTQSATIPLPRDFVTLMRKASDADVQAQMFVRSTAMAAHEIRISLIGGATAQQDRIFAMPMGGMGSASYVKNIGNMLASLSARNSAPSAQQGRPVFLRVEAASLDHAPMGAKLSDCVLKISAKTWL